jgi:hypothetical protein
VIRGLTRRTALATGAATAGSAVAQDNAPLLIRYRGATVGVPNLVEFETWYIRWLGLTLRERGKVSRAVAESWGAPAAAGRPNILMSPDPNPDVFIRAVEIDPVPGYKAMTTWGWNAIEIIVKDIPALHARLKQSTFTFVGEPAPLRRYPTIVAMQVKGPAEEILYLTCETGDASKSPLPVAKSPVDRIFIMVGGGPDVVKMQGWYAETFNMKRNAINDATTDIVRKAQGKTMQDPLPTTLLYLKNHGNIMQLDGYTDAATARPRAPGQLPPGIAMTSFAIASLDGLAVTYHAPPARLDSVAYAGRRAATTVGAATELVELIEGD